MTFRVQTRKKKRKLTLEIINLMLKFFVQFYFGLISMLGTTKTIDRISKFQKWIQNRNILIQKRRMDHKYYKITENIYIFLVKMNSNIRHRK